MQIPFPAQQKTSLLLGVLFSFIFSVCAHAALEPLSLDEINEKIETLSNEPESEGGKLLEVLKDLRSVIGQKAASEEKLESLKADIKNLPTQLESVSAQFTASSEDKRAIDEALELDAIQESMAMAMDDLSAAKIELATLIKSELERNSRGATIPDTLSKLSLELIGIGDPSYPNKMTNPLDVASYHLAIARKTSIKVNIESLKVEQLYIEEAKELMNAKKVLLNQRMENQTAYIEKLQPVLKKSVDEAAQKVKEKAEAQLARFKNIPELKEYAEEIAEYSALKNELSLQLSEVQTFERETSALLIKTKEQYASAKSRIELMESSGFKIDTETGGLLRLQRIQLKTPEQLRDRLETNLLSSTELQLKQLKLDNKLQMIPLSSESVANRLVSENSLSSEDGIEILGMLKQHRDVIQSVNQNYGKTVKALQSVNGVTRDSIETVEEYSLYLDERLLWIPSAPVVGFSEVKVEIESVVHLITKSLPKWVSELVRDISKSWFFWFFGIVLLVLLLIRRKRYKEVLGMTADIAGKRNCTNALATFQSLWVSFLIVLPLPLIFAFLAWRGDVPSSVSQGLKFVAFFLAILGTMKVLLHPRGLLAAHLGLSEAQRKLMSKHVTWFYLTIPAVLFTATALHAESLHPESGRFIFIVMMLIVVVFLHTLLRPSKGLLVRDDSQTFPRVIYAVVIAIPLLFIVGVCMGYIESVQTIRLLVVGTALLILVTFLFSKVCLRLTLVSRRRIAKDQAKKKHKAMLAAKTEESAGDDALKGKATASLDEIEAEAVNIVAVEEQTTRMVRVVMVLIIAFGLWNIWSSTLPALSALDNVKLGTEKVEQSETVSTGNATDALTGNINVDQSAQSDVVEAETAELVDNRTTLKDILWAIVLLGLTFVFARNLPGLIEMLVLRRLNLQPGGNYAVTTILRYAIVLIGGLLVFGQIGITWSSVQWLAAAVTLGIGFGLQEIFANFVAGIILLFERPVRLGDVVTVGDCSGRITQINIRATTIQQFNNRELVVPNKEFITGQLINWTLTDNLLRYEFYVGIAYGSDTKKATDVMNEVMDNHPKVSKEKATDINFKAFGNSTLDFRLRGYVRSPEDLVSVPSDLHYEIDRRFREEEIELAFPQTDIHIRSLPEAVHLRSLIETDDEKVR